MRRYNGFVRILVIFVSVGGFLGARVFRPLDNRICVYTGHNVVIRSVRVFEVLIDVWVPPDLGHLCFLQSLL